MTGSIEKRGKNSYRLVVFKGYDLDGKPIRHQKTIHCKKKSEAQIELAKFLTEVESGLIVDGNIPTFAQYVEIWTKEQVDVATVSARLGHAQITTTYNFYVHPLNSHDRTAGNVLENLLISSKAN